MSGEETGKVSELLEGEIEDYEGRSSIYSLKY